MSSGLLAAIAVAFAAGCRAPAEPVPPVRVAGRPWSGNTTPVVIGGTQKAALEPGRAEHVLTLGALPASPMLRLAAGRRATDGGPVRFEAVLQRAGGAAVSLYAHELSAAEWDVTGVDLTSRDAEGGRLVLRASGAPDALRDAAWAEPVVSSATAAPPRSAILVSIDSLRADRVGVYGARIPTPTLDALARAGGWYEQAYTSSTWTLPSHTCLLYGLTFGTLFHNCQYSCEPTTPAGVRPLPELLQADGYLTAAFTGGGYVAPQFGFGRGFDTYYAYRRTTEGCTPDRFDGPAVVEHAADWLRGVGRAPFFLFLHTYDVHDECPVKPAGLEDGVTPWPDPGPEGRRPVVEHYETQVTRFDALLGRLVAVLDELGLADTTLVVVTSDHGQAFWEHGFQGHGCPLKPYTELAHVPLVLRFPAAGWRPGGVGTPVSMADIAPTILAGLGRPVPSWMEGRLLPGLGADAPSRPIYVQCGDVLAVREGSRKLILSLSARFPDELYDLDTDPEERRDRAAVGDPAEAALRAHVASYWRMAAGGELPKPMARPDVETRAQLRALGYVDGSKGADGGESDQNH